jgi:hypothetical protein
MISIVPTVKTKKPQPTLKSDSKVAPYNCDPETFLKVYKDTLNTIGTKCTSKVYDTANMLYSHETVAESVITVVNDSILPKELHEYGFSASTPIDAKSELISLIFNGVSSLGKLDEYFDNNMTGRDKVVQSVGSKLHELDVVGDLQLLPYSGCTIKILVAKPVIPKCVAKIMPMKSTVVKTQEIVKAVKPVENNTLKAEKLFKTLRALKPYNDLSVEEIIEALEIGGLPPIAMKLL